MGVSSSILNSLVTAEIGSEYVATSHAYTEVCWVSDTKGVIVYGGNSDDILAKVFDVSIDGVITFGSEYNIDNSLEYTVRKCVYCPSQDKVLVVFTWYKSTAPYSNYHYSKALTISGTTISSGSRISIGSGWSGAFALAYDNDLNCVHVAYSNNDTKKVYIRYIYGTTLTSLSTVREVASEFRSYLKLCYDQGGSLILSWVSSNNMYVVAGTISGTTYTWGTGTSILYVTSNALTYDTQSATVVAMGGYNHDLYFKPLTISGTSITQGTEKSVYINEGTWHPYGYIEYDARSNRCFVYITDGESGKSRYCLVKVLKSGAIGVGSQHTVDGEYIYKPSAKNGRAAFFNNIYGSTKKLRLATIR